MQREPIPVHPPHSAPPSPSGAGIRLITVHSRASHRSLFGDPLGSPAVRDPGLPDRAPGPFFAFPTMLSGRPAAAHPEGALRLLRSFDWEIIRFCTLREFFRFWKTGSLLPMYNSKLRSIRCLREGVHRATHSLRSPSPCSGGVHPRPMLNATRYKECRSGLPNMSRGLAKRTVCARKSR